jgi:hypothetical protein
VLSEELLCEMHSKDSLNIIITTIGGTKARILHRKNITESSGKVLVLPTSFGNSRASAASSIIIKKLKKIVKRFIPQTCKHKKNIVKSIGSLS